MISSISFLKVRKTDLVQEYDSKSFGELIHSIEINFTSLKCGGNHHPTIF